MLAIKDIHKATMNMQTLLLVLPDLNAMMKALVNSQTVMSQAATSMAETFAKSERRQVELEENNIKLYEHKGVSDKVFFMVVATLLFVIICLIVWITGLNVRGSYTDFEIGKNQNKIEQNQINQSKINKNIQEKITQLEEGK